MAFRRIGYAAHPLIPPKDDELPPVLPPRDDDDAKEEVERPSEDAFPFLPLAFEDDDEEEEEEESAPTGLVVCSLHRFVPRTPEDTRRAAHARIASSDNEANKGAIPVFASVNRH